MSSHQLTPAVSSELIARFLADNTAILRVILKYFRLLLTISSRQNSNRSAIFALLAGLGNGHFASILWAFCRRLATLPCRTSTSCLVALFSCDIDSTQVPQQSSLHFVSQSSVTPKLNCNATLLLACFSRLWLPGSSSQEDSCVPGHR